MSNIRYKTRVLAAMVLAFSVIYPIAELTAGTPHPAKFHPIQNSDSSTPAKVNLHFQAYIVGRPTDILTETSTGCEYEIYTGEGRITVECGNFTANWTAGDVLHVYVWNTANGESAHKEGTLTNAGYDDFGDITLPVELSSFTALANDGVVTLKWKTESELNNLGFNIYRSLVDKNDYKKLNATLIPGAGNSSTAHDYSFADRDVENGVTYFYKLESIDFDGSSRFHGPIEVFVEGITIPDKFSLEQNYPNPFNPTTAIKYSLPQTSYVRLRVYNTLGVVVKELVNEEQEAGIYTVNWDGRSDKGVVLPAGIYIYELKTTEFNQYKKMIFAK